MKSCFMIILLSLVFFPLNGESNLCEQNKQEFQLGDIYSGSGDLLYRSEEQKSKALHWAEILNSKVQEKTVVIVSESPHYYKYHNQTQKNVVRSLMQIGRKKGFSVNVGMELIEASFTDKIQDYVYAVIEEIKDGKVDEKYLQLLDSQFISQIGWSPEVPNPLNPTEKIDPLKGYKPVILFPYLERTLPGKTIGLNVPSALISRVAEVGIENLTEEEALFVPETYEVGNEDYKERFLEVLKRHPDPSDGRKRNPEFSFQAQSLWDEVMATHTVDFLNENSKSMMVIVVGAFHSDFNDGLVTRLRALGVENIVNISQRSLFFHSIRGNKKNWLCHPKYNERADFVVVTQ